MRNDILSRNEIANLIETIQNSGNQSILVLLFIASLSNGHLKSKIFYLILDIPSEIDNYHALFLLEPLAIHQKLPLPSSTYKATQISTGIKYCLRRLHGK